MLIYKPSGIRCLAIASWDMREKKRGLPAAPHNIDVFFLGVMISLGLPPASFLLPVEKSLPRPARGSGAAGAGAGVGFRRRFGARVSPQGRWPRRRPARFLPRTTFPRLRSNCRNPALAAPSPGAGQRRNRVNVPGGEDTAESGHRPMRRNADAQCPRQADSHPHTSF